LDRACSWYPGALKELLRKDLRAFQPGGCLRGADNFQALSMEMIGNTRHQGRFRSDNRQIDTARFGKLGEARDLRWRR
jgi:predicted dinucleotide-utilizing enzyme